MNLSEHFTRKEFEHSNTAVDIGIDNRVPENYLGNAKRVCELAEIVRRILQRPLKVNSGYRSYFLNKELRKQGYKSSNTSAHCFGCAIDIACNKEEQEQIKEHFLKCENLEFDQVILYWKNGQNFVHLGVTKIINSLPRKQVLYKTKQGYELA